MTIIDTGFSSIGDGNGVTLWLEPDSSGIGGGNLVGIRSDEGSEAGGPEPIVKSSGIVDFSNNSVINRGPPTLMLVRIQIDAIGTFDAFGFWVNPSLTGAPSGLESQILYSKSGVDLFGSSFDAIGISFSSGLNLIDSIRISDSLDGVGVVGATAGIPEPESSMTWILLLFVGYTALLCPIARSRA